MVDDGDAQSSDDADDDEVAEDADAGDWVGTAALHVLLRGCCVQRHRGSKGGRYKKGGYSAESAVSIEAIVVEIYS